MSEEVVINDDTIDQSISELVELIKIEKQDVTNLTDIYNNFLAIQKTKQYATKDGKTVLEYVTPNPHKLADEDNESIRTTIYGSVLAKYAAYRLLDIDDIDPVTI